MSEQNKVVRKQYGVGCFNGTRNIVHRIYDTREACNSDNAGWGSVIYVRTVTERWERLYFAHSTKRVKVSESFTPWVEESVARAREAAHV